MTLHIYKCENPKRTRRLCPHHRKLEYGELRDFYDTIRIFFDCGTFVDYGYGYYKPPLKYKRLRIFWDGQLQQYVLWGDYGNKLLFSDENRKKILRIANERLKPKGKITDLAASVASSKDASQ
mgnify:CR=1 FL=1